MRTLVYITNIDAEETTRLVFADPAERKKFLKFVVSELNEGGVTVQQFDNTTAEKILNDRSQEELSRATGWLGQFYAYKTGAR